MDSQLFLRLMISAIKGPIERVTILFEKGMLLETEFVVITLSIFEFSILLIAWLSHKTLFINISYSEARKHKLFEHPFA